MMEIQQMKLMNNLLNNLEWIIQYYFELIT